MARMTCSNQVRRGRCCRPGGAGDEAFPAWFRAEARYAASLSPSGHRPGSTTTAKSAEFGGAVPGHGSWSTASRCPRSWPARAWLSPDATLDIVSQAARALDAAHQARHRAPRHQAAATSLVAAGGTTKITDFGIATAVAAAQASHLTETGMVMGTAMYVSPEQGPPAPR